MWEVRIEMYSTPKKRMAFHCTDFHETPNCSMTFLPDLYRTSTKPVGEETNYRKTFNTLFE